MPHDNLDEKIASMSLKVRQMQQQLFNIGSDLQDKVLFNYRQKILNKLSELFLISDSFNLLEKLKQFLIDNWELIKGTPLCYTALPFHELTSLLVEIATLLKDNTANDSKWALTFLMPTISTDSLVAEYPSLNEVQDITEILSTYILGQEAGYLIPVKQFLSLHTSFPHESYNIYYDYQTHSPEMAILGQEEFERLVKHSPDTEALYDAYCQYQNILQQQDSLLFHLRELCKYLRFNSIDGVGAETNAGHGAYPAIIQFYSYWNRLSQANKSRIPSKILQEIELLFNLSSDMAQNSNATQNLQTCIATRRQKLTIAMQHEEPILAEIGLEQHEKINLINEKKQHWLTCQNSIINALEQKNYRGFDKLGLTESLLTKLHIPYTILSKNDLQDFLKLSVNEIINLAQHAEIRQQLIDQIDTLETFVLFAHETGTTKLQAIMSLIGKQLADKLLQNRDNIIAILITFDDERMQIICSAMQERIFEIVERPYTVKYILTSLDAKQQLLFCQTLANKFPLILKNFYSFKIIFLTLDPTVRTEFCNIIKDCFPNLTPDAINIKRIFELLNSQQKPIAFEKIKYLLPAAITAINAITDLSDVLKYLGIEQFLEACNILKEKLITHISSAKNFKNLFQILTKQQRKIFFEQIYTHIPWMISNVYDFRDILYFLNHRQRLLAYRMMQDQLPQPKSAAEFKILMQLLTAAIRSEIYKKMHIQLCCSLIYDLSTLKIVLAVLNVQDGILLCKALHDQIAKWIKSADEFSNLLQSLPLKQCIIICKEMQNQLDFLNLAAIIILFNSLSPVKCKVICSFNKRHLLKIIEDSADLINLLKNIPCKQYHNVCNLLTSNISAFIFSLETLITILLPLSPKQCYAFLMQMQNHFSDYIENIYDVISLLQPLTLAQRISVYHAISKNLPSINNIESFKMLLELFPVNTRIVICNDLQDQFANIIKNPVSPISFLYNEEYNIIYNALLNKFPQIKDTMQASFNIQICENYDQEIIIYGSESIIEQLKNNIFINIPLKYKTYEIYDMHARENWTIHGFIIGMQQLRKTIGPHIKCYLIDELISFINKLPKENIIIKHIDWQILNYWSYELSKIKAGFSFRSKLPNNSQQLTNYKKLINIFSSIYQASNCYPKEQMVFEFLESEKQIKNAWCQPMPSSNEIKIFTNFFACTIAKSNKAEATSGSMSPYAALP